MSLIEKAYFTLEELQERWTMPHRDIAYLAENGLLRLSVRLFGVELERGVYEKGDNGEWFSLPEERLRFSGFQDLQERDVYRLFRQDTIEVDYFHMPGNAYCNPIEPSCPVLVRRDDLLVRREERDRVEAQHELVRHVPAAPSLQQTNDYREVRVGALLFNLGPVQAGVVRQLHEATRAANAWREGKSILGAAGSASTRMADVFKSQPQWRRLIESDGRGRYRLRLAQRARTAEHAK
jgi:hypothetical protein